MKRHGLLLLAAPVLVMAFGCVSAQKALPLASSRAGCARTDIEVVRQDGHDVVLRVCGRLENWKWNALGGWEFAGEASSPKVSRAPDGDGDGIEDARDACPAQAGPASSLDIHENGCPPPQDSDGDGVSDDIDACATDPGAPSTDQAATGCPDADADGVVDRVDACRALAGVPSDDATRNGCPPDGDGDGVPDAHDACPDAAGPPNADAVVSGCPEQDD